MRCSFLVALLFVLGMSACTNHGKKYKVEGTKAEIYYKGDGLTEDDAKKTGEFLKKVYILPDKEASIQIVKEKEDYTLRFVYNKAIYDSVKGLEDEFKVIGVKASKEVFGGKKVNIALADDHFKDFKTIPYDEATAKRLEEPANKGQEIVSSKNEFEHDAMGGVNFYWKGISDEESKTIAEYIVKNGAFAGGTAEIYMTKEGERYILRFPMIESARTDPAYLAEVDKVARQIKENVFSNVPYSFYVTDEQLMSVKTFDY